MVITETSSGQCHFHKKYNNDFFYYKRQNCQIEIVFFFLQNLGLYGYISQSKRLLSIMNS